MKVKIEYIVITLLIFLIIGGFIGWSVKKIKVIEVPKIVEVVKTDTIIIEKKRKIILPAKLVKVIDTLKIYDGDYGLEYGYASSDTTIEDDNLRLSIKYLFEKNLFDVDYKLRNKEIIRYLEKPKNWKDNLGIYVGWSVGYNLNTKKIYQGIGISVGYRIK